MLITETPQPQIVEKHDPLITRRNFHQDVEDEWQCPRSHFWSHSKAKNHKSSIPCYERDKWAIDMKMKQ